MNALRDALRIISGKNVFICKSGKSADFPDLLFHEEGVVAANGICSAAFCESAALRGYPFRHRLRRCHLPQGDGF